MAQICSEPELRTRFDETNDHVTRRQLPGLDRHARAFIALCPFAIIGTCHPTRGADVSPRGDAPGFVQVIDARTLCIPDRPGNNRLDSMSNILANPAVGLLFLIPGLDEMLRVNGDAIVVDDLDLRNAAAIGGRPPKTVLKVDVREVFLHCGKSMKRSRLWSPSHWPERGILPSLAQMTADQIGAPERLQELQDKISRNYRDNLY